MAFKMKKPSMTQGTAAHKSAMKHSGGNHAGVYPNKEQRDAHIARFKDGHIKHRSKDLRKKAVEDLPKSPIKKKDKVEKDFEKGKITEKHFNQLVRAIAKTTNKSQAEIGVELGISAGKVNQLMKSYETYFIKKQNEEVKLKLENTGLKNE